MSSTTAGVVTPPFGAALESMLIFSQVCLRQDLQIDKVQQTWADFQSKVIIPSGIETGPLPEKKVELPAFLKEITPQVRGIFDARIMDIFKGKAFNGDVIREQEIDFNEVRRAMRWNLISEGPANALFQAAALYGEIDNGSKPAGIGLAALGAVGAALAVFSLFSKSDAGTINWLLGFVPGLAMFVGSIALGFASIASDKHEENLANMRD
jgi:hypothetical protein